ncbi:MAG TPA: protein-methionine-sulfoxide reductase catalytic subunit MsrP [Steroidobacteraceae bacterium]|nr:protein-methionine-sulfoxide reductase catalytic subunit MsrP [Steroidobacteraceae bacterium]
MALRIPKIPPSEITPPEVYFNRRAFLGGALAAGVGASLGPAAAAVLPGQAGAALAFTPNPKESVAALVHASGQDETPNTWEEITNYNNYYEFGVGKTDPAAQAHALSTNPWSIAVEGEAGVTGTFHLEDFLKPYALEERIYRFRCVEAWSMVIPWVGLPLPTLLQRFKPTSKAKYVAFETVYRPAQMPGQASWPAILPWPYREGLRLDEAMNPLALMVVGLYGRELPNQSGAPLRLIVPWKYGFKSLKAIVKIRFTETQPRTTWNIAAPGEYGFYANVNPNVPHPRWSQATERRIGAPLFHQRQPTLMFNGYADEVAYLYRGMDLHRYF